MVRGRDGLFPPLIYILTMEPLLRRLWANPDTKGIQIKGREYKTAAFADDLLIFLSDPFTSLPVLMKDFEHFRVLSNLKINYAKSHALNISLHPELIS